MIVECTGDILKSPAQVILIPVNCVPGVLGAGLAKQAALKWPHLIKHHKLDCELGRLQPGRITLAPVPAHMLSAMATEDAGIPVFAATKAHWKDPSRLRWIHGILDMLLDLKVPPDYGPVRSAAIPALGCGLGGLRFQDVYRLIKGFDLCAGDEFQTFLYPPHGETGR